jgi:flagellar hook assembly protein FlgD
MVIQGSDTGREIWKISFEPASPNPFAEQTALRFSLPEASNVSLAVYNVNGQLVRMLQSGQVSAGTHQVMWDGRDDSGARVARGVYFCRMETAGFSATEKIVMLK